MGNAHSSSSTSDVLPVEYYLNDLACGEPIESLGSTRFMKVARGRNSEGACVWKVFLTQEDSSVLEPYRKEIFRIRDALVNAPNCCTVKRIYVTPKCAVLIRPFQKQTLCDRLSTRPFIVQQEKIWYIYQLFKAVSQCQKVNVCHGDLKSQNILLSSSNWLQITDFAPFKPSYLPHDNPSSFTFFFDTSRHQHCYLAPERFLSSIDYEVLHKEKGDKWLFGSLEASMDLFAAGCVVYELLHESGKPPFSYGELCHYRRMSASEAATFLERLLHNISAEFRPLLKLLLNREPSMRVTAHQVLDGSVFHFPKVLDSFFSYLNAFRPKDLTTSQSLEGFEQSHLTFQLEPDDVIAKLKRDEKSFWDRLTESDENRPYAILFISLITANIRVLRSVPAKIDAMNLLIKLASLCSPAVATERVLPYLVSCLSEFDARVRAAAVHSITELVRPIEPTTFEDSLVFIDYLLPELASMLSDKRHPCPTHVLLAVAINLGDLAETAYRFHVVGRNLRNGVADDEISGAENISEAQQAADEKSALQKALSELFEMLCSSQDNSVRHCALNRKSLEKLYTFFSRMNCGEILLRHMITFLNVKSDWRLRAAFFESLPICVQKNRREFDVKPLLQQGLHDFEEIVVIHALHCTTILVGTGVLERNEVLELLEDILPFLSHPNEWIRLTVIELLILLDSRWALADIQCRLLPMVRPYLNEALLRLNNKLVVSTCLKQPIPRDTWKKVTELSTEQTEALQFILERGIRGGAITCNDSWFTKIFGRDTADPELFEKLSRFHRLLQKMAEFRRTAGMESELTQHKGIIDLSSKLHANVRRNAYQYLTNSTSQNKVVVPADMNNEWNEMFGDSDKLSDDRSNEERNTTNLQMQARSMRTSVCGAQLAELLQHKSELFYRKFGGGGGLRMGSRPSSSTAKISGTLITHLHEHSDKVTQLAAQPDRTRFASSSLDGSVLFWNVQNAVGEGSGAIRSDASFTFDKNYPVSSIGWASNEILAMAVGNGHVLWTDNGGGDTRVLTKVQLPSFEGPPEQIHVSNNITYLRSHHGVIYCLDLRVGRTNGSLGFHEVWRREVIKYHGLVTSFCVDPFMENWLVMCSTNKELMLWDLRFQVEVLAWKTPNGLLPLKLWSNSLSPSIGQTPPEIFAAYGSRGEVDLFELGTTGPVRTLWPSLSDPFTYAQSSAPDDDLRNVTTALCVCQDTGFVYTGDSEGSLRRWNLSRAPLCEYISGPREMNARSPYRIAYNEMAASAGQPATIYELRVPNEQTKLRSYPDLRSQPTSRHRTSVSDVLSLQSDLLISGSSEGVIKIWK
ncbi:unnamed protein product [Cylicocyclus nassatus]|uniref:non-specific serine/threonine protein kinase n=1 Tax=Cylicocyclus nassatus TaxID=53992 RepID=A0AA36HBI4_CYLNA|nr:unnamed protein product [Cylicocyclus nassatus]